MKTRMLGCLAALCLLAASPAAAQDEADLTGRWDIDFRRHAGRVRVELSSRSNRHHTDTEVPFGDLVGLSEAAVEGDGEVSFRLERPAGVIHFEGDVRRRHGSGTFRFVAARVFVDGLARLGYDTPSPRELLVLATQDVDLAFAGDLTKMGFHRVDVEDLLKAAIFDVTTDFVAEARRLGLGGHDLEDFVKMRIFDIDAALVADFEGLGFRVGDLEELVQLQVHGVDPAFVRDVRALGFDPSIDDLVQMKIFHVDKAFVDEMAAAGYAGLSVDELVQLRIFGIDREYIESMREAGVEGVDDVVGSKLFERRPNRKRNRHD